MAQVRKHLCTMHACSNVAYIIETYKHFGWIQPAQKYGSSFLKGSPLEDATKCGQSRFINGSGCFDSWGDGIV